MTTIEKVKQLALSVTNVAEQYGLGSSITDLNELIKKAEQQQISLLVCGEFKRGKSSLINAFLNENVCPEAEGIATSVVSLISYGETRKVIRHYGRKVDEAETVESKTEEIPFERIADFADGTESDIQHTIMLEIQIPNERLKNGLTIIDTPGVGSLDPRHLLLTLQAIPKADVIYFVTDADEPMGKSELDFYKSRVISTGKKSRIVVNKIDSRSRVELKTILKDVQDKSQCDEDRILPVSAKRWKEYNSTNKEEFKEKSHLEEMYAAVEKDCLAARDNLSQLVRSQYIEILERLKKTIEQHKNELSDFSVLDEKKAQYQQQIAELKQLHDNVANPDSELRRKIAEILKESQKQVLGTFAEQSVLLSSNELDKILQADEAKSSNGDQFVLKKVNDAIVELSERLDKEINAGLNQIIETIGKQIELPECSFKGVINTQITPVQHTLSETTMSTVRQSIPLMGVATLSGIAVSVVAPAIALPVGIVAGIAFVAKNIFDSSRQERVNNIRRQITPRVQIAINELQRYIQNRYDKFNDVLLKCLKESANEMIKPMQEVIESIKQCEAGTQERKTEIQKIDCQLRFVDGLIAQTRVYNTNPFVSPQSNE